MSSPSPFNPKLVIGLIVAGALAFGAMMLSLAYGGGEAGAGGDGRAHALSESATGYKGLFTLVRELQGARLVRDTEGLGTTDLVIVALEPRSQAEDVRRLIAARRGPTLFILPKWVTVPDSQHGGWVLALSPGAGGAAVQALDAAIELRAPGGARDATVASQGIASGISFPVPDSAQAIDGKQLVSIVPFPGGGALVAQLDGQSSYVVADPDLLNNHGLADPETARATIALIDALNPNGADGVAFDLTVNGFGRSADPSLLRLAFEPPFIALTLALLTAALLAGLHGANRFGPVARELRAIAFGKAALVENSAGLVRLAGREARLGSAYADVVRHEAARAVHAPAGLQSAALDAYLDRLSRGPGGGSKTRRFSLRTIPPTTAREGNAPSFSELVRAVEQAPDRHHLLTAARALAQWKKAVVR